MGLLHFIVASSTKYSEIPEQLPPNSIIVWSDFGDAETKQTLAGLVRFSKFYPSLFKDLQAYK